MDSESEQSSQEIEDKPVQKDKKKKTQSNDVEEGKTVFVRYVHMHTRIFEFVL